MKKQTLKLLTIVFILLLSGCPTPPEITKPDQTVITEESAFKHYQNGQYELAAKHYEQLIASTSSPDKEKYQLLAAESYIYTHNYTQASQILDNISPNTNDISIKYKAIILRAWASLKNKQPEEALKSLQTPFPQKLDVAIIQKYYRLRAEAFKLNGKPIESATELMFLEKYLESPQSVIENQKNLLSGLQTLTDASLKILQVPPPDIFSGWMDLAIILKNTQNDTARQNLLINWKLAFTNHPAINSELLYEYIDKDIKTIETIHTIALLLPSQGKWKNAAITLRDGFLSAHYNETKENKPSINLYYYEAPEKVVEQYLLAVSDGADIIVGPIDEESVALLAQSNTLKPPVLALNNLKPEAIIPPRFYQFKASSEDEARLTAEKIWRDGHTKVATIVPQGLWGNKVALAFEQRWIELGGILLEQQKYPPRQTDYASSIKSLLNLDESNRRQKKIQQYVVNDFQYEPRRRQDVDAIFIAALPKQARLILPQLQFYRANDLPVYSTSHTYSAQSDENNEDLNGLLFCGIPWLLTNEPSAELSKERLLELWPETRQSFFQLFALGIDSYNILSQLNFLQQSPVNMFQGRSGQLYLDTKQRIHRQLVWAKIARGMPSILEPSPRMDIISESIGESPFSINNNSQDMNNQTPLPTEYIEAKIN
ncbi:MAG: tetratricopeptide repeat protein [Methylococcales bacterium]|jgi:uncharacterized protein|nr:tetratricopeptide repeat protein [Methylococcales bacterium]MBT7409581.1 tetratricopeptide repeat protein [Methylococcales bacterium]